MRFPRSCLSLPRSRPLSVLPLEFRHNQNVSFAPTDSAAYFESSGLRSSLFFDQSTHRSPTISKHYLIMRFTVRWSPGDNHGEHSFASFFHKPVVYASSTKSDTRWMSQPRWPHKGSNGRRVFLPTTGPTTSFGSIEKSKVSFSHLLITTMIHEELFSPQVVTALSHDLFISGIKHFARNPRLAPRILNVIFFRGMRMVGHEPAALIGQHAL